GGAEHFPGQRFTGREPGDSTGQLTFAETVLAEGEAAQTGTAPEWRNLRWQDYVQTATDPVDDCTVWYVGDYFKKDATSYSTRIGAFRMPGCKGSYCGVIDPELLRTFADGSSLYARTRAHPSAERTQSTCAGC